jgi:hypothetical protein
MAHRQVQARHQRAFNADCEVEARRVAGAMVEIIDHVYAAGKAQSAIDHCQLAVHAPQAMAAKCEAPHFRSIHQDLYTCHLQHMAQSVFEVACAETVYQHPHDDTAPRRGRQRSGDATTCWVVGEDIGFEVDFMPRFSDRLDQCRKIFDA